MGRKVYRVPPTFDWPLKEPWEGYLNPYRRHRADCPACAGSGYGPEGKRFQDEWYGNAPFDPAAYGAVPLAPDAPEVRAFAERNVDRDTHFYEVPRIGREAAVRREMGRLYGLWRGQWCHHLIWDDVAALFEAGRLYDFSHTFVPGEGWRWIEPVPTVTAAQVNAWSLSGGMGHDSINQHVCVKARCRREGVPVECRECDGDGERWSSPSHKAQHDAWQPTEPPAGEGWQLWQTTGEDSPISPVFATAEELAAWAAENATTFGGNRAGREEWLAMIAEDRVRHQEGSLVFL